MKKLLKLTAIFMIFISIFLSSKNIVFGNEATTPLYLGIIAKMTGDTPNMGYASGTPGTTGAFKIWNFVKYTNATSNDPTEIDAFCLRDGVGFTDGTLSSVGYNVYYDMKKEREAIKAQNTILNELVEKNITENGTTYSRYNALLAVIDMLYLPGKSDESQKQELLQEILEYAKKSSEYNSYVGLIPVYPLTNDDITAVQQAVIWYFTNYGEENGKYDKTSNIGWLNYTTDEVTYEPLSDYNTSTHEGLARSAQADILYNLMIQKAKANANNYANSASESTSAPAQINTTTLSYKAQGSNYIIGPINITETSGNTIPYTIDFVVKNNNSAISNYTLLDENQTAVGTGTTVKDLVGKDFYISVPKASAQSITINMNIKYTTIKATLWAYTQDNQAQPMLIPEVANGEISKELNVVPKELDFALRKYITKVNDVNVTNSRVPNIDVSTLTTGTTATYKHRKDPVEVTTGSKVTYKLTVYNEGEKEGRATKIVDQLPTGLRFSKVVSGNFELDTYNEETNTLNLKRISSNETNLPAYTTGNLASETIEIECEVTATPDVKNNKILTNVAWISEEYNAKEQVTITNQKGADRDSEPETITTKTKDELVTEDNGYIGNSANNGKDLNNKDEYFEGQQDDDDFEKLVMLPESFDLKLIKRIVAVNNQNVPERIESVDVSELNTLDENGNMITTGDYILNKEPVGVKKGDIVTYTFRIYNEGTIDGYAQEITEEIPEGLEFIWSEKQGEELKADTTLTDEEKEAVEFNQKYLWKNFVYDDNKEKVIKISSDYLSKENETTVGGNLIPAFGENDGTKTEKDISYKEVSVKLKVTSDATGETIKNEACISEDCDEDGNPVDDRDSDTEDWKDHPNHEDDEDHDYITLQSFDLALRKFIIAISKDTTIENKEYLKNTDGSYKREPVVDTSKLNTTDENGKLITTATYNHTKEPILVQQKDIIVYMLRVYNEGEIDGYASEIKDHLPSHLEFVEGEFNEKYGWELEEDGRTVTTRYLENAKINKPEVSQDGKITLSYKEVPIMCEVKENAKTSEKITNIADITEYLDEDKKIITDRDSEKDNVKVPDDDKLPGYKDDEIGEYIPGQEDDDDFEKVIVKIFDLALRKWVTQAIVTDSNGQTVTETGHQPYDDPEQIVKVELHRKKLNEVVVKFRYSIRVTNEGELEGYAKEITDYVPQGLKFVAEDNPGWTDEGNNVISTRLLENTLLQPGEYADVEVVLTWINNENNMGVMTNTAEISEDYNEYGVPDKDSTPDNQKLGEDDIDDAPVMISISTGQMRIYFTLGFIVLITMAGGVVLIKKFVL